MEKILIIFLGVFFLLTGCSNFEKEIIDENQETIILNSKILEFFFNNVGFFANTELINNFTRYKSSEEEYTYLNKLEIVDNRTSLNRLALFSKSPLDDVKIKIFPCSQMPLSFEKKVKILWDCFEINPGTTFEVSREDFLVFPEKIFKNIEDYNFGQSKEKGGVLLMSSTNQEHWDETFSGHYIENNNHEVYLSLFYPNSKESEKTKIYFTMYFNFNGYYYIDFKDRKYK